MKFSRAVQADPLRAPLDTSKDGPDRLVEKIDIVSGRPTPYSPLFEPGKTPEPRVFELRTYTCPSPEKLAFLHDRFRNHTMRLFAKHGMENLVYFQPLDLEDSDRKLVYLLAHKSHDAAQKSFAGFRADPEWLKAKRSGCSSTPSRPSQPASSIGSLWPFLRRSRTCFRPPAASSSRSAKTPGFP